MSASDDIKGWVEADRTQAEAIRYLIAVGAQSARGDLSNSQADTLDATAEGWEAVLEAIG